MRTEANIPDLDTRAMIDSICERMDLFADGCDEMVIHIKHADGFDMVPMFIPSFLWGGNWPQTIGREYSAKLVKLEKNVLEYEVKEIR